MHNLKPKQPTGIDSAALDAFKAEFAGQIIVPGDADYESARRIWNASIDKHPAVIARCTGTSDVVRAVKFARANRLLTAVRGGGHNVAGRALCDGGIVIDLSRMTGIFVDAAQRTVRVQGGATLGDLDRETHLHGLAVPTGVVSRTGIGGLALGGGVGWLVRKHGMTCDNILSCEIVTADGRVLTADDENNPDLFWGLRGGGGNFGIVTSFLLRAHPVTSVLGGLVLHPRDQARAVLRHYRDFMTTAPDELTCYGALVSTPDGTPAVGVAACYCGDLAEGERVLKPLRSFGTPMLDIIQPMPFPAMQKLIEASFPENTYNYWKSAFVTSLSDAVIDLAIDHANRMASPLSAVVFEIYGGAAGRVAPDAMAFAQRRADYNINISAQWTDSGDGDKHIAWARGFWDMLRPHSSGGYFLNFLDNEGRDTIRAAFGANYARLAKLKAKYDPDNFFSLNQNVTPAR